MEINDATERDEARGWLGTSGPEGDDGVREAWKAFLDRDGADPEQEFPADIVRRFLSDAAERGELTEDMCLEAVAFDGDVLGFVPEAMRTEDVCREAVASSWTALHAVPDGVFNAEICAEAILSAVHSEMDMESPAVWDAIPEEWHEEVRGIIKDRVKDLGFDFDDEYGCPRP